MLIRFICYIQLAPPLIAGIIMTTTIISVAKLITLYMLLFNIVVCCTTNIPPEI